jgi:glycosyltransferase involved in cell wall biosynthesis
VSVIVAFRDVRRHLDRCIESLLGQHVPRESFEILFIDNNSTDGGNAAVTARSHIRLLVEPKPGVYTARNRAVKEARGEILAFTDPDCQVEPDWVEHITSAMRDPGVGIVLGQRLPPTDHGPLKRVMAYESQKTAYVTRRGVADLFFGHGNNMAVRREVMDRVGPFLERSRGSDTILVRRAVDAYGPGIVRYCPEMRVRHLEVSDLATYYRKNRIYGQSNTGVAEQVRYRPLTLRERLQVFRETMRNNRFSAFQGAQLLLLLIPGMLCYEWGRRVTTRSLVGWRRAAASFAGAASDSKDAQSR